MKVILILLLFNICTINSISPPKFPKDFSTNYDYIFKNSTITKSFNGHIAEDNENKTFTEVIIYPDHSMRQTLYNKALYYVTRNVNGKVTECVCFNTSYESIGCPYFNLFQHFEIYEQNETDIYWKVIDIPLPFGMTILFRVKKESPNIPEEEIILVRIPKYSPSDANSTYIGFEPSQPNKESFDIPVECMKVECKSGSPNMASPFVYGARGRVEEWFNP